MAKQRVMHGAIIDFVTPDEMVRMIPRPEQTTRVRAPAVVQLDANGNGVVTVYKVPIGYEFNARRVTVGINSASDPSTGNIALNVGGKFVVYQRSGNAIEYGQPQYGGAVQVPGVQTWGDQQGPYLRNGETFEVRVAGLTANAQFTATVEGILKRESTEPH